MKRLLLYLTAVTVLFATGCHQPESGQHVQVGETLPDFKTCTIAGNEIGTENLAGSPSLIVFFETLCPDCVKELPTIEQLYKDFGEGMSFLAIARSESELVVSDYWETSGFTMPVAAPGSRELYNLFDRGSMSGVPQVYVSDENREVVAYFDDKHLFTYDEFVEKLGGHLSLVQ